MPEARRFRLRPLPWFLGALLMSLSGTEARGDTIAVPADFPTIQEAVDAAANGDSITVSAGTYDEWVTIEGKQLTVVGEGPRETLLRNSMVIDLSSDVELTGFDMSVSQIPATAVFVDRSSKAMLRDCWIHDTDGRLGSPGGLFAGLDAEVRCERVDFTGNASGRGGGAGILGAKVAWFTDCRFQENSVSSNLNEAGAASVRAIDTRFVRCTFLDNTAVEGALGIVGALRLADPGLGEPSTVLLEGCVFAGNEGLSYGAVYFSFPPASAEIRSCAFIDNVGPQGGSAIEFDLTSGSVANCIFGGNGPGATIGCGIGTVTVSCTDMWANADNSIYVDGGNNITLDPLFCGVDRWDLQAASPCAPTNNPACGLIGPNGVGCASPVATTTWGRVKSLYREAARCR